MRLPRPHIPIEVECRVALRQLGEMFPDDVIRGHKRNLGVLRDDLILRLAGLLFPGQEVVDFQLDHNPPLACRQQFKNGRGEVVRYVPAANDPEYLFFRERHSHFIKTNVRGDGAQHPDRVLIKRERRRGRKKRPKQKIRSRGFRKVARRRRRQLPLPPRRKPR